MIGRATSQIFAGGLENRMLVEARRGETESSASRLRAENSAAEGGGREPNIECDAREIENAQRLLGMLPHGVWVKIVDNLDSQNDLFPLALSCRFFRQKQKELGSRKRREQSGSGSEEPRRPLKTRLRRFLLRRQPASAEYLRFWRTVEMSRECGDLRDLRIRRLAAYHGHLPLLQELGFTGSYRDAKNHNVGIAEEAGESFSSSLFPHLLASASDLFLLFFPSQRLDANWRPCSG